jgi:hypothetical protein
MRVSGTGSGHPSRFILDTRMDLKKLAAWTHDKPKIPHPRRIDPMILDGWMDLWLDCQQFKNTKKKKSLPPLAIVVI